MSELALFEPSESVLDRVQMYRDEKGITARVEVTMTEEQWNEAFRSFAMKAMCCSIGLDSPSLRDFIVFQVIGQVKGFSKRNRDRQATATAAPPPTTSEVTKRKIRDR